MLKISSLILITLLTNGLFGQDYLAIQTKIIPLRSNRKDVERIAKRVENSTSPFEYETESEYLNLYYSESACVRSGWNVPADHVLAFRSYPKKGLFLREILKSAGTHLIHTGGDDGTQFYTNEHDGMQFVVRASTEQVEYIRFTPSSRDQGLRCSGFPPYDSVSENYSAYQGGKIGNPKTWDPGLIVATLARVRDEPNLRGFIFVYCSRGSNAPCTSIRDKIRRVAKMVLNDNNQRLTISLGGYRDNLEVESFLIPNGWPPAKPRPTYPSGL